MLFIRQQKRNFYTINITIYIIKYLLLEKFIKLLNYSFKTVFNYNNKSLDICELLKEPTKGFDKGNYFVNIFKSNKIIANTSFVLD